MTLIKLNKDIVSPSYVVISGELKGLVIAAPSWKSAPTQHSKLFPAYFTFNWR
jgi:hypothetical protein